ncbi:MAG TPA: cytochrome c oxidase subunit I, partial [Candidatus Limnocylindrales bacterium]|nr:cytochrome c oxidase subunit I [Candidatus Limnocylindrales bacterium]
MSPGDRQRAFETVWNDPRGVIGFVRTVQNIPLAHRYMVTAFAFFLLGGVQALVLRLQLATADGGVVDAARYNQLFTMHGTTMMFLFVIPFLEAIANYLLPLILGTRDLPFPRLTALSYWTYLFGGLFLYTSFIAGTVPDGGWFAYVPLTGARYSPGLGMDFWDIGLSVAEVAALGAAAELIVGVLRMRAPGMRLDRLPLFAWTILITAVMIVFAFTPLIVGTAMLELDRKGLTVFFDPEAGGKPLLWQHLFWVFGHPEVYIMFVPAVGIVSHVVQTFARRPMVGYPLMVLAVVATGVLSFGLWVHHMFTTGLSPVAMGFFTAASLMIAVPSGVQVFGWIATLWTGRPVWRVPLLFVVGFLAIFVLGGLTGVMLAVVPFNWQVHDSYFVVGHFHYVLIGGVIFPVFGGLYYWLPKMTGRRLSERLGRWNFWTMFVFFNVAFFPMHVSGLLGMPRRIYTYPPGLGWEPYNLVSTLGAFGFAAGVLLFVVNVIWSLRAGPPAGANPWDADGLEWAESSPPAEAQFARIPVVASRHPLWQQATLEATDEATRRLLAPLDTAPTRWRGGLVVSTLEARPLALVHLPGPTLAPFALSVGFTLLFTAALLDSVGFTIAGAVVSALALTAWFWPRASERLAIEEAGTSEEPGRLTLAVAGSRANGWWGTIVLVLILATALATLLASYAYLVGGQAAPRPGSGMVAVMAAVALGLAAAATRATASSVHHGRPWGLRVALGSATAAHAAALAVTIAAFLASDVTAARDARDS